MIKTSTSSAAKISPTSFSQGCQAYVKPLLPPNKYTCNVFLPFFPKITTKITELCNWKWQPLHWGIENCVCELDHPFHYFSGGISNHLAKSSTWVRQRKLAQSQHWQKSSAEDEHTDRSVCVDTLYKWSYMYFEKRKTLPSSKRTLDKDFNTSCISVLDQLHNFLHHHSPTDGKLQQQTDKYLTHKHVQSLQNSW